MNNSSNDICTMKHYLTRFSHLWITFLISLALLKEWYSHCTIGEFILIIDWSNRRESTYIYGQGACCRPVISSRGYWCILIWTLIWFIFNNGTKKLNVIKGDHKLRKTSSCDRKRFLYQGHFNNFREKILLKTISRPFKVGQVP